MGSLAKTGPKSGHARTTQAYRDGHHASVGVCTAVPPVSRVCAGICLDLRRFSPAAVHKNLLAGLSMEPSTEEVCLGVGGIILSLLRGLRQKWPLAPPSVISLGVLLCQKAINKNRSRSQFDR